MALALEGLLRCPVCRAEVARADDGAAFVCAGCRQRYAVADEIPRFLVDALPGIAQKRAECAGWVAKATREGWYEPDDAVDAVLPFLCRDLGVVDSTWAANEQSFQTMLDRYVRRGMCILEVGAAKCWAAQHVLPLGCEYVATDVLADACIGLGRGSFYAARVGDFARLQADGEHLPFADASFDITFCTATLHHALDVRRMVGEFARVTAPGGLVAALNEGTRALGASADAPEQESERALGINEHVHTVWAYLAAFARAGLRVRRVQPGINELRYGFARAVARVPKLGMTLAAVGELSVGPYAGVTIFARKPRR